MIERGFSISTLLKETGVKKQATQQMLEELSEMERQAMALVGLFKRHRYLTIEKLAELLKDQQIGPVRFSDLVSFLAGYMAAESYDSQFDKAIFGKMAMAMEEKRITVGASLAAFLNYMDTTEEAAFPDRRQTGMNDLADLQTAKEELDPELEELLSSAEIEPADEETEEKRPE